MSDVQDLLFEIGTEELPPKALLTLPDALAQEITRQLQQAELTFDQVQTFATPRRLAIKIDQLAMRQPRRQVSKRGPAYQAAFTPQGEPTAAALGFAKSCGVGVDALDVRQTPQGKWLWFEQEQTGQSTLDVLPSLLEAALAKLPLTKPMRWGIHTTAFARPVHWVVLLLGGEVVDCEIYGIRTDRLTYGHRFLQPETISLSHPRDYERQLQQAFVIADFVKRRQTIQQQIQQLCQQQSVVAQVNEALLDEVTCIVEWPVAHWAQFDSQFLQVPAECLIAAMQDHQKSFPVMDADQHLLAKFIFIANIDSRDSARMIAGNEKVMRARLADAAFFYNADQQQTLADRIEATGHVVFQQALGSLFDKSQRLIALGRILAMQTHADGATVERACTLAKCDLMTDMVGEFPELQGIMGYHYALLQGESVEVAQALREQYLPRFATDELPSCATGITLALAERIDTLVGIFGIGQAPTGDKDPFKLRRAALGIIRILVAHELTMDLPQVLEAACAAYPDLSREQTVTQVQAFILERAKVWLQHEQGVTADVIQAVIARQQCDVLDLTRRIEAVQEFCQLEQAQALAAANKRVSNLLTKQAKATALPTFNRELLIEAEEIQLADHLQHIAQQVQPLCDSQQYTQAFSQLAQLQQPIDEFFDHVMVMVDDMNLRHNRLALLQQVRDLFWQIADVSLLQL